MRVLPVSIYPLSRRYESPTCQYIALVKGVWEFYLSVYIPCQGGMKVVPVSIYLLSRGYESPTCQYISLVKGVWELHLLVYIPCQGGMRVPPVSIYPLSRGYESCTCQYISLVKGVWESHLSVYIRCHLSRYLSGHTQQLFTSHPQIVYHCHAHLPASWHSEHCDSNISLEALIKWPCKFIHVTDFNAPAMYSYQKENLFGETVKFTKFMSPSEWNRLTLPRYTNCTNKIVCLYSYVLSHCWLFLLLIQAARSFT